MHYFVFIIFLFLYSFQKKAILVGGALDDDNLEIYQSIMSMPGTSHINIAVITAASEVSLAEENGKYYINLFKKNAPAGISVDAFWVPIDTDKIYNNKNPNVIKDVSNSNIIFFGGGDQDRLMTCFVEKNGTFSPVLSIIMNGFEKSEIFVAGTSAGSAIQTDPKLGLVSGGESFEAFRNGVHKERDPDHPDNLSYMVNGGFGVVSGFLTDTHFSDRGREGRIIRLGLYVSADWVIGVDQNTAVLVENNKIMEVMGESGVFFFDLRKATLSSHLVEKVYATYLTEGDSLEFDTSKNVNVKFASYKTSLIGREEYHYPMRDREDIWSSPDNYDSISNDRRYPKEFAIIATDLCDVYGTNSTKGTSYHSPVQTVNFYKTSDTLRYEGKTKGDKKKISFHKMLISVDF